MLRVIVLFLATLLALSASADKEVVIQPQSEETPWTTWSSYTFNTPALLELREIRNNLLELNLHDPHINYAGYGEIECAPDAFKYRTADGTCYLEDSPFVGASHTAFGRNIDPKFIDRDGRKNIMVPNREDGKIKEVPFLNMLAASWIQFMNHDWLTHGKNESKRPMRVEGAAADVAMVERTKENTVDASTYKSEYGKTTINEVTHWWDGSQIYGSTQDEQNTLRTFSRGKMKVRTVDGKEMLPLDNSLDIRNNVQNKGYELTGFRDNWWVGLSMLHTLFVKEHNAIADMLYKEYVNDSKDMAGKYLWGTPESRARANGVNVKRFTEQQLDEHIFQVARLINSAVMAKIHTVEWTPAILANKTLKIAMRANWYGLANPTSWLPVVGLDAETRADWFSFTKSGAVFGGIIGDTRDDAGVPYSITEEFTSVYRLHSLLPESLVLKKQATGEVADVPLKDTRNEKSNPIMEEYSLEDLYYSFGTQKPGQIVLNNFPAFFQNLEIPGRGKMDLGMVDIMRDRERGVPRYNQFRRAINLKPIQSYSDFFPKNKPLGEREKAVIAKFNAVYGKDAEGKDNVEMIDLLVGTLAEEVRPAGFGFGETQFQIFILMASRRLMADPFFTDKYTDEYYTAKGIEWVDTSGKFADVLLRHMPEVAPKIDGLDTPFAPWNE